MVGGHDQDHGLQVGTCGMQRGHWHGGGAVLALGFEHDVGGNPELAALLGDNEPGRVRGDHGRLGDHGRIRDPLKAGVDDRGLRIHQPGELLGHALERGRPQTGARAAAQDRRMDLNVETRH